MSPRRPLLKQLKHTVAASIILLLSLAFLPLGAFVYVWSSVTRALYKQNKARARQCWRQGFEPRVVLVTGLCTPSGLALARSLYQAGHTVVGADWEDDVRNANRFSKALASFYSLPRSLAQAEPAYYAQELLRIIGRENVDLWISCSIGPLRDARARKVIDSSSDGRCKCLHFDVDTVKLLTNKDSFNDHLRSIDRPVPESHPVSSRASVHRILNASNGGGKKYVLRKTGGKDAGPADLTQLPRRTLSQTYQHVSQIPVSTESPFVLEEVVAGDKYRAEALVIRGQVKAFAAAAVTQVALPYLALPEDSPLTQAMLRYASKLVTGLERDVSGFIGVAFTFKKVPVEWGVDLILYATDCNLHPTSSGVPVNCAGSDLGDRLVDVLSPLQPNGTQRPAKLGSDIVHSQPKFEFFDFTHDFFDLVVRPVLDFLALEIGLAPLIKSALRFVQRSLLCIDPIFEWWDPVPWWWTCQVAWPLKLAAGVYRGQQWGDIVAALMHIH